MRYAPALLAVLALLVAGCGDKTKTVTETKPNGQKVTRTVPDIKFAKTKFLLHAGLALGAFHRYIYKPYRAGEFRKGAPHRKRALVKAAAAGAFAVHELKVARKDALADDRLRPLVDRIDGIVKQLGGLTSLIRGGGFNPTALLGTAGAVSALRNASNGRGANIKDRNAPIPGT